MLCTTSRYAPEKLRMQAIALARKSGSRYVARGKKTINDLAGMARRLGHDRIMVVCETVKRTIEIMPDGSWRWADEGKGED